MVAGAGQAASRWLADPVLPSLLPGEVRFSEILQRDTVDEVVQPPSRGDMPDNQDPLSIPAQRQVAEEPADARDGLPPAFPARIRRVEMLETASVQLGRRHPVALPIVTFAEPPVIEHRNRGLAEGGGGCLGRAGEVGA